MHQVTKMEKIDLLMWTLNSEETLPYALKSIDRAIPKKNVNQKFVIDGNSEDKTVKIAEKHGWTVIHSPKRNIAYQANLGLKNVETEFFASFEHDIILNQEWFKKIKESMIPEDVAVSQGLRYSINPTVKVIEKSSYKTRVVSIDNNLYRTELINKLGGFDEKYPVSADRKLQDVVIENGYKWVINRNLISIHFKTDARKMIKGIYEMVSVKDYPEIRDKKNNIKRFFFSPFRSLLLIKEYGNYPLIFLVYPYWRFYIMKASLN